MRKTPASNGETKAMNQTLYALCFRTALSDREDQDPDSESKKDAHR